MKQKLICELRSLGEISKKLIGVSFVTAVLGTIIWISCDGLSFVWHTSRLPPLTPPMPIMYFLWLAVYALFGAIMCQVGAFPCKNSDRCLLDALVAYLSSLFWCPLVFFAGGLASFLAILLSLFCVFLFFRHVGRPSIVSLLCLIAISAVEIYSLYFTAGFVILN